MPELSGFYGMVIRMYPNDHPPPHFHVAYQEARAVIEIGSLAILRGRLPARALGLVREWASLHERELREAWERNERREPARSIAPLP